MSEYSELIKRFDKIRDYMRDFFVFGFKSRECFDMKSLRSYDNERRRIESYLSEYMSFHRDDNGKNVFISVDSSDIPGNPLYRAFKAKTFTKNDITLHFIILDILFNGEKLSANEIADIISEQYMVMFDDPVVFDLSTLRNKLAEYEKLGLLESEKQGRKLFYCLKKTDMNLNNICDALVFFSEVSPLGVVGSFLLDKLKCADNPLCFKHHYIMHALESEIVYELLDAIQKKKKVNIVNHSSHSGKDSVLTVVPLRFLISVQGGRRYLAAYSEKAKTIANFRLDYIKAVEVIGDAEDFDGHYGRLTERLSHNWGASMRTSGELEWLRMKLNIPHNERYIVSRILREGRHGSLTQVDENTYDYYIEVYDAMEMMPWLRTFIGRIVSLECSNKAVVRTFYNDLEAVCRLYDGGGGDAVL